jgi:hypothetical protein
MPVLSYIHQLFDAKHCQTYIESVSQVWITYPIARS